MITTLHGHGLVHKNRRNGNMKNLTVLFLSVFLLTGMLSGCVDSDTQSGNAVETGTDVDFVLGKSLPAVPEQLISYSIKQPNVSTDSVATIGAKFGFLGEAGDIDFSMIGMSNEEKQEILQINVNSGAIEYTCLSELFPLSPSLPDEEDAAKIAVEFLQSVDLWYSDLELEDVTVGGTYAGDPSHLLVRFTRYINGIPLTGPGNKYAVRVGDEGKVIRILVRYPELEQSGEVQIISPEIAFNNLKSGKGFFSLPSDCKEVVISHVYLGYYLDTITQEQEYLMPSYIFKGECRDKRGNSIETFTGWTDAVAK